MRQKRAHATARAPHTCHHATDGLTISKPENRDTVLGGAPESEDCYLDLEQPGMCLTACFVRHNVWLTVFALVCAWCVWGGLGAQAFCLCELLT